MSFKIVSLTSDVWKSLANALSELVEEATFEITPDGVSLRAMDPSRVAMINLTWQNTSFEEYVCDSNSIVSIRVSDLKKVVKRAERKDRVEVSLGEGNTLLFKFSNGYEREFAIPLTEVSETHRPLPRLSFNVQAKLVHKALRRILEDINTVSDHVVIKAEENSIEFRGRSEIGQVRARLTDTSPDLLELNVGESSEATYSLEYLVDFTRAIKTAEIVMLEFSSRMPVKLSFPLDEHGSTIEFYLAPRVE